MIEKLKSWDGKSKDGRYQYPIEGDWEYFEDELGNIYYETKENPKRMMIWCSARKLNRHLHFLLVQLPARR